MAGAKDRVAIGFSNLVARLEGEDEIGFAGPEYRVHILEALRTGGINAVGAESLVFSKDEAARADLVLGGTVKEFGCQKVGRVTNCRIGVWWEVLDRETDRVAYRVFTRHMEAAVPMDNHAVTGKRLILGALRSLRARTRFVELTTRAPTLPPSDANYHVATFRPCQPPARELPGSFSDVADATVVLKNAQGFGSGFFLGPDGLILSAAHVVENGGIQVRRRDGTTLGGRVIRLSRQHDVALIAVEGTSGTTFPCLALNTSSKQPGTDVYAIGTPASQDLASSLTRGIISGIRSIGLARLIQTDASVSPGNSGGPLIDQQARVIGVVSRKLAAESVEGVGFAIPIEVALAALKLESSFETSTELLRGAGARAGLGKPPAPVTDVEDRLPSLDPEGDRRRRAVRDRIERERTWRAGIPGYITPLRVTSYTVGSIGASAAVISWLVVRGNSDSLTHARYEGLRLTNDLSWAAMLLGTGGVVASYVLQPARPAVASPASGIGLRVGVADVGLEGKF